LHTTTATGTAEREAALVMVQRRIAPGTETHRPTLAADKNYDTADFVAALQSLDVAPHISAKAKGSAVPAAVKATEDYGVSLRRRKMIEEAFGWVKEIGTLRRVMARGLDIIRAHVLLNFAAYNLTRLSNLLAP
jgi:IS5 family transposase